MPSGRQPNHTFNDDSVQTVPDATNTTDYETWQMERLVILMNDAVDLTKEEKGRIAAWFYERYSEC